VAKKEELEVGEIEKELMEATNEAPKRRESRQQWLRRLVGAVQATPSWVWNDISTEGQEWVNEAALVINDGTEDDPVPEPDGEPEGVEDTSNKENEVAAKTDKGNGAASKRTAAKKTTVAKDPAKRTAKKDDGEKAPRAARAMNPNSAIFQIKLAMLKHPGSSIAEIKAILDKQDVAVSEVTISTVKSHFAHAVAVLKSEGLLKDSVQV
jgi:hypothetical protein